MKRENTNKIRYILEEIFPPIIRDSLIFKFIIKKFMKNKFQEKFKSNIHKMSSREYEKLYENYNNIHENSDLSEICINEIIKYIKPGKVIDVGCGQGFLLKKIRKKFKKIDLTGVEMKISTDLKRKLKNHKIKLLEIKIENLNKITHKYDTVICTHVLEHVLDINMAYNNLKKICKKKLIIIVPKERPYEHTFNAHVHFFPYKWSFINTIRPKNKFTIKDLKRDLIYIENVH